MIIRHYYNLLLFSLICVSLYGQDPCNLSINVPTDITLCEGETVNLAGVINGPYDSYEWLENGSPTSYQIGDDILVSTPTTFTLAATYINPINLVSNGDFESGNTGFNSDYNYNAGTGLGGLGQGSYNIDVVSPFLWTNCVSPDGNMMVMNAATVANVDVYCTDVNVEPGEDYIFTADIMNINNPPPILQFSINGVLLGSTFTGGAPCVSEEFFQTWNSGANTTATICIVNQSTVAAGNDFSLDNISFFKVCNEDASFTVTPTMFSASLTAPGVLDCSNTETEIEVIPDPVGLYNYDWANTGNIIFSSLDGSFIQVDQAGFYTVTVTDINNCTHDYTIEVSSSGQVPQVAISNSNDLDCTFTSSNLNASSPDPSLTYTWYTDLLNPPIGNSNSLTITSPGTYFVIGYDASNGCSKTEEITVEQDTITSPIDILNSGNFNCLTDTVSLSANVISGNISWSLLGTNTVLSQIDSLIIDSPGTYIAALTQDNGCASSDTITVTETTAIFDYQVSNDTLINCSILQANISVNLDTSIYEITWSTLDISYNDSLDFAIANEGTYNYIITDTIGCQQLDSISIVADLTPPEVDLISDTLRCTDPIAIIYIDDNVGTYNIQWTDLSNNIFNTDSIITNVANTYNYVVTGNNGCSTTGSVDVIAVDAIPQLSIAGDTITCKLPTIDLVSNSDVPVTDYNWTLPNNQIISTPNISTSMSGTYTLDIISDTGCTTTASYDVAVDTIAPVIVPLSDITLDCNLMILDTFAMITTDYENIVPDGSWLDLSNLGINISDEGIYTYTVYGSNGCTTQDVFIVDVDMAIPDFNLSVTNNLNCTENTATITSNINSNIASIDSILWPGQSGNDNMSTLIVNSAGGYACSIIGTNGCESSQFINVTIDTIVPQLSVSSENIDCNNTVSEIIVNATGDISVINYYTNGSLVATGNEYSTSSGSDIYIEVIGLNTCSSDTTITIGIDTSTVDFVLDADNLNCNTPNTQITINANSSYLSTDIYNSQNVYLGDENLTIDVGGSYDVTLTTSNGCTSTESINIELTLPPSIQNIESELIDCSENLIINELNILGGNAPLDILINGQIADITAPYSLEGAGNYLIEVIDQDGCSTDTTLSIIPLQNITASIIPEITLQEGETIELELIINNGSAEITNISWSPQVNLDCYDCVNPIFFGDTNTEYLVTITNINGCIVEARVAIFIAEEADIYAPNIISPNSSNTNNQGFTIFSNDGDILLIENLSIYDRWGNLIFRKEAFAANNTSLGWDGTFKNQEALEGVYTYIATVRIIGGNIKNLSGDVSLIR